jgi:hypothetical protein
MTRRIKSRWILWYQALGFLLLIMMSWLDELLNLPYRLFPGPGHSNWREAAMETLMILAVWTVAFILTRRLLARLHYLEEFLKVCAWCRRIGKGDDWFSMEQFFDKSFSVKTSHGICPDCAKKMTLGTMTAGQSSVGAKPENLRGG